MKKEKTKIPMNFTIDIDTALKLKTMNQNTSKLVNDFLRSITYQTEEQRTIRELEEEINKQETKINAEQIQLATLKARLEKIKSQDLAAMKEEATKLFKLAKGLRASGWNDTGDDI